MNLENKKEVLFSIGDFAEKAHVTLRTLRYYDNIGLLQPSSHTQTGNRLYSQQDFARLQKILTLKFIGLSLDEISDVLKQDINEQDFAKSLEIQRKILDEKLQHMHMLINAIDETLHMVNNNKELDWDKFVDIISVINADKKWLGQYENASNLRARINIHELYSTNKEGWMHWFFKQIYKSPEMRVLEIGCGDASLWIKNYESIPESWHITLTDFSPGMIEDAKRNLGKMQGRFSFKIVDAQAIPFEDESFDIVIANHMLYHVPDKDKAFSEIKRVLKTDGYFYASTVGKNHMKELRDIIMLIGIDTITSKSWDETENFQLENGMKQISKYFKQVKLRRYEDNLIVKEADPLIDYIFSMPGNIRTAFDEKLQNKLALFINSEISKNGGIFIKKDTGYFEGRK